MSSSEPTTGAATVEMGGAPSDEPLHERADVGPIPGRPILGRRILGRYVLIEEVGRGGMGVVYRAYDKRLTREVALKFLRAGRYTSEAQQRLIREAWTMAKLNHANVVSVYDVELSASDVIVAMEYVAGTTLDAWLEQSPRAWSAVVQCFVEAGAGLQAAHHAGVLHRDFKPSNVLVGDDGRVRVVDFGLARTTDDATGSGSATASTSGDAGFVAGSDLRLTSAGTVMGTPPFMAPEQHVWGPIDAAADQYAFCVSLWTALASARPFVVRDGSLDGWVHAKLRGPPPWPRQVRVPRRLVAALRRGLAPRPVDRWPSMGRLLDELRACLPRSRPRWSAVGLLVAVAGVSAGGVQVWLGQRESLCTGAAAQLADVWDRERGIELREIVLRTGTAYAESTWMRVEPALQAYADAWLQMHRDNCEATSVRREQSAEVMDLRMECLHRHKLRFAGVLEVLGRADPDVVARADAMVAGLPAIDACADVQRLEATAAPPGDAETIARIGELRSAMAAVRAELDAGKHREAEASLNRATALAIDLAYPPVVTELAYLRADLLQITDHYPEAERAAIEALEQALQQARWDEAVDSAALLTSVVGADLSRPSEGLAYGRLALGLAQRARSGPLAEAVARHNLGTVYIATGQFAAAERELRRAVEVREGVYGPDHAKTWSARSELARCYEEQARFDEAEILYEQWLRWSLVHLGPDHPETARAHENLGFVYHHQGRYAESDAAYRRSLAIFEAAFGPDGLDTAWARSQLAYADMDSGRYEAAEQGFRAALAAMQRTLGPDHDDVGSLHSGLALSLDNLGRYEESQAEHRKALAIRSKHLGEDHPLVARARAEASLVSISLGRPAEAERAHRDAIAIVSAAAGPDHVDVIAMRNSLANLLRLTDRLDESLAEYQAVRALVEQKFDATHPQLADAWRGIADVHRARGQHSDALAAYERAWEIGRTANRPVFIGDLAFEVAEAAWQVGKRARALEMAREAEASYGSLGEAGTEDAKRIARWIRDHGG